MKKPTSQTSRTRLLRQGISPTINELENRRVKVQEANRILDGLHGRSPKRLEETERHRTMPEIIDDFWKRVDIRGSKECWEWKGIRSIKRYGFMLVNCRRIRTHRFSALLHLGDVPEGMVVCHRCDNPPCCNPDHLFLGTVIDNISDRVRKGRGAVGASVASAKLDDYKVSQIRARWSSGEMIAPLALEFGVTISTLSKAARRETWKHVK